MFMIHTPQSIDLLTIPLEDPREVAPTREQWEKAGYALDNYPKEYATEGAAAEPEHHGTISFDHEGDDVSKCRMIITRDDKVFTYTFNTRGNLLSATYDDDKTREAKAAQAKAAKEAEDAAEAAATEADKAKVAEHDANARETKSANHPAM
jgi:hypothetical protein